MGTLPKIHVASFLGVGAMLSPRLKLPAVFNCNITPRRHSTLTLSWPIAFEREL